MRDSIPLSERPWLEQNVMILEAPSHGDTKATLNISPYSRGGISRGLQTVKAADHDMMIKEKLVPGGILDTNTGTVTVMTEVYEKGATK